MKKMTRSKKILTFGFIVFFSLFSVFLIGRFLFWDPDYSEAASSQNTIEPEQNVSKFQHETVPLEDSEIVRSEYSTPSEFTQDLNTQFKNLTSDVEKDRDQITHLAQSIVVYTKYFIDKGIEDSKVQDDFAEMRKNALNVVNNYDKDSVQKLQENLYDLDNYLN